MITIQMPAPSSMLVANLLGVLGLLAVVAAVGLLAGGAAWALLTGGLVLVALSLVATSHAAGAEAAARPPAPPPE